MSVSQPLPVDRQWTRWVLLQCDLLHPPWVEQPLLPRGLIGVDGLARVLHCGSVPVNMVSRVGDGLDSAIW